MSGDETTSTPTLQRPKARKSKTSWKQKLRERIPPHKHCSVCGRAIPLDREFCSQECADHYRGFEKKKEKRSYMQIVFLVIMMVVMFAFLGFIG